MKTEINKLMDSLFIFNIPEKQGTVSMKILKERQHNESGYVVLNTNMNFEDTKPTTKKEPMQNFVVTHNTKINNDFHTTDIICSFANRDDAINYVTDMNCESKAEGNYNWYQFVETEVH